MLQDQNHFSMWCFFWYIWDFSEISNLADHEYGTISEKANLIWARSSYTTNLKRLSIKRKPCNWCRTAAHCLWPQSQSHIRILQKWKIQWWLSPISHAHIFSFLNLESSFLCTLYLPEVICIIWNWHWYMQPFVKEDTFWVDKKWRGSC